MEGPRHLLGGVRAAVPSTQSSSCCAAATHGASGNAETPSTPAPPRSNRRRRFRSKSRAGIVGTFSAADAGRASCDRFLSIANCPSSLSSLSRSALPFLWSTCVMSFQVTNRPDLLCGWRLLAVALTLLVANPAAADPERWRLAWPDTDFAKHSVDLRSIRSGGPPKDGIPSIDNPTFVPVSEDSDLAAKEPVISLDIAGDARAYPLRVLMWHEIVNDTVGGVPVAVTYCPAMQCCDRLRPPARRASSRFRDHRKTPQIRPCHV